MTKSGITESDWAKFGLSKTTGGGGENDNEECAAAEFSARPNDLFTEDQKSTVARPWWKTNFFVQEPVLFGTWDGVFTSVLINIFGVIVFIRTGWMVGNAGIEQAVLILIVSSALALIPVMSAIGICERCQCQSGGVYFLVSHVLGGRIGAAVGVMYTIGQAVASALVAIGFGESMASLLHTDNSWVVRGIAITITLALVGINMAGVKWVIKLQLVLLVLLFLGIFDFVIGSFVSRDSEHGVTGFSTVNWRNNTGPAYQHNDNFFTVFGVFFSTFTGVLSGCNMSGDLKNPSKNIPLGELTALLASTLMCLIFVLVLGAVCQRQFLMTDFMIAEKVSWLGFLFLTALYISSLSSILGSLYGAPRVLQSIASENVIPFMKRLEAGRGPNRVPVYGIIVITIVSILFILVGKLNLLAQIATMPYLLTYAFINYAYVSLAMTFDLQQQRLLQYGLGYNTLVPPGRGVAPSYGSMDLSKVPRSDLDQLFPERTKLASHSPKQTVDFEHPEDPDSLSLLKDTVGERRPAIVIQPSSWYSVFSSRWVALVGAVVNFALIFMVHWPFALVHIGLLVVIYAYVGKVNPGVFSGISEFRLSQSFRLLFSRCIGGYQDEKDPVVIPPFQPEMQTTTTRLNEENVDYSTRSQYHQSMKEQMQDFD